MHAEFTVIVDGGFEPVEGENGLPEGLDHRNAPHIFDRLVAHALERVLVLPHILLHGRARHAHHDGKAESDRDQAGDAVAPIVQEQHDQHTERHGDGARHIRQVVREQRFRGTGHLRHDPAHLAGAHFIRKVDGQAGNMAHQLLSHIGGRAECAAVRTDQRGHVHEPGQHREQHGHPPVADDPCGLRKVRLHIQHFPDDPPQVHEGQQRQHAAQGRQDQREIRQRPAASRIFHQAAEGRR